MPKMIRPKPIPAGVEPIRKYFPDDDEVWELNPLDVAATLHAQLVALNRAKNAANAEAKRTGNRSSNEVKQATNAKRDAKIVADAKRIRTAMRSYERMKLPALLKELKIAADPSHVKKSDFLRALRKRHARSLSERRIAQILAQNGVEIL
jgi:hypothetical protein